jgi:hypothetical protein
MTAFSALTDLPRWVAWYYEVRGGKATKVPYGRGDRRAKADDPATWLTMAEAQAAARRLVNGSGGGIGIELGDLGADQHLGGLDLDSCLIDGVMADWAQRILEAVGSYAEISPSESGIKVYFFIATEDVRRFLDRIGVPPEGQGCRRAVPGHDSRDHGPAIEVYVGARYFAVTEARWPAAPETIRLLDTETLDALAALIPSPAGASSSRQHSSDTSRSGVAFGKVCQWRSAGMVSSFDELVLALHADPDTVEWTREKGEANGQRELRRLWNRTASVGAEGVRLDDFWGYMPLHRFIFAPARDLWPAASINARLPRVPLVGANGDPVLDDDGNQVTIKASAWLDRYRAVETMTWAPGQPMILPNRLAAESAIIERQGVTSFNLYRPPPALHGGDARRAKRWRDHLRRLYPEKSEADHIERWFAHRLRYPAEKPNHAIVLGGLQGIGKDTLIEPIKRGVGPWNCAEVSPRTIVEAKFNGFARSILLRISEARDLGEVNRYAFYEAMKIYTAAPPDVLRVNEKNLREYHILNCCGVVVTTNYKAGGIYLPADDRRHFVAWSPCKKEDFSAEYWKELWTWYETGGIADVAAYLVDLDLSGFNPKAPPPKTPAFWDIVDANRAPEDSELADLLDNLGGPDCITLTRLLDNTRNISGLVDGIGLWLNDRKNRRVIPHRMEACGYVPVRNPDADDGLWKIADKRQAMYAKATLSLRDQLEAAAKLTRPRSV